jgi:L-fuculose-phosphate aldolase
MFSAELLNPQRRPQRFQLEQAMVDYSHRMHAAGFVANHDGNITCRLMPAGFLATPTAVSKAAVARELLLVVDEAGKKISGRTQPFSELSLHLYVYRHRADVQVVMHAHPPTATGLAVAGVSIVTTMMAEPVVSLGAHVPLVPYAKPKSPEFTTSVGPFLKNADALLLQNHGVLTWGPDFETAYLRMELVEHLAKIQLVAMQAGGVRTVAPDDVTALLQARAKAGLGPAETITA